MPDFPSLHPEEGGAKINDIYTDVSPQALGQLVDYITQSGIPIPVSQIIGFSQTAPQQASVGATESTTSTTYTDLTTPGPTISGLSNGKYLIIVSAAMNISTAGWAALMAPSINGATPTDDTAAVIGVAQIGTSSNFSVATLSSGSNSVKAQYRSNHAAITAQFFYRNLIVIRMANA